MVEMTGAEIKKIIEELKQVAPLSKIAEISSVQRQRMYELLDKDDSDSISETALVKKLKFLRNSLLELPKGERSLGKLRDSLCVEAKVEFGFSPSEDVYKDLLTILNQMFVRETSGNEKAEPEKPKFIIVSNHKSPDINVAILFKTLLSSKVDIVELDCKEYKDYMLSERSIVPDKLILIGGVGKNSISKMLFDFCQETKFNDSEVKIPENPKKLNAILSSKDEKIIIIHGKNSSGTDTMNLAKTFIKKLNL